MKSLALFVIGIAIHFSAVCQNKVAAADTFMLDTVLIDGKVKKFEFTGWKVEEGTRAVFSYTIKNVTDSTLEVELASSSSGFSAMFERQVLSPGETARVMYVLSAATKEGACNKGMFIRYWQPGRQYETFRMILGKVIGKIE